MRLAVTGASGKTGWRIVDEARLRGHQVVPILRPNSQLPDCLVADGLPLKRLNLPIKMPWWLP